MKKNDLLLLLHDIKMYDIENLSLDLPLEIRVRIVKALAKFTAPDKEKKLYYLYRNENDKD